MNINQTVTSIQSDGGQATAPEPTDPRTDELRRDLNEKTAENIEEDQSQDDVTEKKDYSVFSSRSKRVIIATASLAAWFSPLSAQSYLPSLNQIAQDLGVSVSQINLSVTTYMIMQGLAPTMIAGFSESAGRRMAYLICFTIYIPANIGLALQSNYAALLVLRLLQSGGSSGTVALANGVVADMVTSADRGTYIGYAQLGSILGPALGPLLGGLIGNFAGWKWIFGFLAILSTVFFTVLALFMPETARRVVGDGSVPPPIRNRSITSNILLKRRARQGLGPDQEMVEACRKSNKIRVPNPLRTLKIIVDKEAGLLLICNGFVIACLMAVSTALPSQFFDIYGLNELQIALCFLPISAGSLFSAFTTGRLVNYNYRRHAKRTNFPLVLTKRQDLTTFPIERARIEVALPLCYLGAAVVIVYGWVLHTRTSLAGPLVLLFFIGYSIVAAYQVTAVLLVDIYPSEPATATAANNLVRCLLSAGAAAVVTPLINGIGSGWAYTLAALIWVSFSPCFWLLIKWGPQWRREKKMKEEEKDAITKAQGA